VGSLPRIPGLLPLSTLFRLVWMDVIVERSAALDVHKEQVTACVRVPDADGARSEQVVQCKTTVRGLLTPRDWPAAHRVTQVAMEATGVYWKPVWAVLEDEFELLLVNPRHVKQVPGRKTDVSDAAWLCQLLEAGLLRASFVPPKPIRVPRSFTRYRKAQIAERQREANRLHKALEDTGIKLDCVATDILGVSGRDYFHQRNPERQTRRLVAQLEALGHTVTLQEAA
jgi:transposase